MGIPFPNEKALAPEDLINLGRDGTFEDFETEVGPLKDYTYTQASNNGHIVLARPKPGVSGAHWAFDVQDPNGPEWCQNAMFDPTTGSLDLTNSPQAQAQVAPVGSCPGCGSSVTGLPAGSKFCPVCSSPLAAAPAARAPQMPPVPHVPTPGQLRPGQSPVAGAGHIPPPAHINPNRMEPRPEVKLDIPKGMQSSTHNGFADALDAMLAEADSKPDEA